MAFQYVLTFSLLIVEMVLFALISLPLPSTMRRPLLRTLSIPFHTPQFQMIMRCVFVFIGIMFVDSVNRTLKVDRELAGLSPTGDYAGIGAGVGGVAVGGGVSRAEIQSRRFYSQRNMYLCGFTLFLSLILNRTSSMVFDLLEIKEKWRKLEASGATLSGTEKSTASVEEENAKLKLKIEALKTEKESLLKKSTALSDEY